MSGATNVHPSHMTLDEAKGASLYHQFNGVNLSAPLWFDLEDSEKRPWIEGARFEPEHKARNEMERLEMIRRSRDNQAEV